MKKLIIVIIILLIVGGIIYFLGFKGKAGSSFLTIFSQLVGKKTGSEINNQPTNQPPGLNIEIDPTIKLQNDLTLTARVFIERYGSWSNQSNFENFEDLYPLMTDSLKTQTQSFIAQQQANKTYYSLETKILSLDLTNLVVDTSAEFSASVQQQEIKDSNDSTLYKTVKLVLLKQGTDWKVDQIIFNP